MISIVDYGMGNIGSLENMILKAGGVPRIIRSPSEVREAEKLILPGVGHFDNAMRILGESGLKDALNEAVLGSRCPILCICLGAQLVTGGSEEGNLPGLGWIKGYTKTFSFKEKGIGLRIPHMGWNNIVPQKPSSLLVGLDEDLYFYFVHSFHLVLEDREDILATTIYGYPFHSAIERGNVFATQFHPEKSHKYGMRLIKNFVEL